MTGRKLLHMRGYCSGQLFFWGYIESFIFCISLFCIFVFCTFVFLTGRRLVQVGGYCPDQLGKRRATYPSQPFLCPLPIRKLKLPFPGNEKIDLGN